VIVDGHDLSGCSNAAPSTHVTSEIEKVDRRGVLVRPPFVSRKHPHQLEFVAVRVGAIDALRRTMTRFAGVCVRVDQSTAGRGEFIDRVELPGEVVQADRTTPF